MLDENQFRNDSEQFQYYRIYRNVDMLTGVPLTPRGQPPMDDVTFHSYLWQKHRDYVFSVALVYCIGFSAVWRYPHIEYRNMEGHSSLLYPFLIMVTILSYPLSYIDIALGQYTSRGPMTAFRICPVLKGLGYTMIICCVALPFFIVLNMAYACVFTYIALFHKDIIGSKYQDIPVCIGEEFFRDFGQTRLVNCSNSDTKYLALVYFWRGFIANSSPDYDQWVLAFSVILCWALVFYSLSRGIVSAYRIIKWTFFPAWIVIICFIIICVTDKGAGKFLLFYFEPNWRVTFDYEVWVEASKEALMSVGSVSGVLIALGSMYDFRDRLLYRHARTLGLSISTAHFLMGILFYSSVGIVEHKNNNTQIRELIPSDVNLVYVLYAEVIRKWYAPHLAMFLFYLALVIIGWNSCTILLETFCLAILARFEYIRMHKTYWTFILCTIYMMLMLLECSRGGSILSMETMLITTGGTLLPVGFFKMLAIVIYGNKRFYTDCEFMLNSAPSIFFRFFWYLDFFLLLVLLAGNIYINCRYIHISVKTLLGLLIAITVILPIPIIAIKQIIYCLKYGNFRELCTPELDAGPKYQIWRAMRESFIGLRDLKKMEYDEIRNQGRQ